MKRRVADQLDAWGSTWTRVRFFKAATDRVWLRDSAPTFVVKNQPSAGGRSIPSGWSTGSSTAGPSTTTTAATHRLPRKFERWLKLRRWVPRVEQGGQPVRVVMEGGAIDVNGRGTLLTTEECLLGEVQARNPGLDRAAIERIFADYLGVRHVVWLGRGIDGDDTHGHVDDLARFVDPRPWSRSSSRAPTTRTTSRSRRTSAGLQAARDQDGQPLRVVELPMPRPVIFDGQRLPASYANFYIANGLVLVPTFNDPADRIALDTLARSFPTARSSGIHCVDLVLGLGTLHCLSQQQPAGSGPDRPSRCRVR